MSEAMSTLEDAAEIVYRNLSRSRQTKCDICGEWATHYFYARGEFSTFRYRDHRDAPAG